LLAANAANAAIIVELMTSIKLAAAFGVVFAVDVCAALLIFAVLIGRQRDPQQLQSLLLPQSRRPAFAGSAMSVALERVLQQTMPHFDAADDGAYRPPASAT
jgi:hypothetical protein